MNSPANYSRWMIKDFHCIWIHWTGWTLISPYVIFIRWCVFLCLWKSVPQHNVLQWLMFTLRFFFCFFYKARSFFSEFKSNLLKTLLCTKSKQGVQIFHHAVFLSSVVLGCSKHCSQPYTSIAHSTVMEQESWPAANSSRMRNSKLETDIREFK